MLSGPPTRIQAKALVALETGPPTLPYLSRLVSRCTGAAQGEPTLDPYTWRIVSSLYGWPFTCDCEAIGVAADVAPSDGIHVAEL
jgi:hypothetical protein